MAYAIIFKHADVAEWQTQQTQNLPVVTSCGFKSHHPHLEKEKTQIYIWVFSFSYGDEPLEPMVQGLLAINGSSVGSAEKRSTGPFS